MAHGKYPVVPLSMAGELHLNARKLLASGIDMEIGEDCIARGC